MSPFEPKTDARDFDATSPARPLQTGGMPATAPADITIRLWRGDPAGNSALTWNTDSVFVYMIADLVAASRGSTASDAASAMTAHFANASQALVAARRIQLSILEFVACKPGDYLGAAILIHPPATAGFGPATAQSALRLTEPGQIILSDGASQSLRDLPGIELRPVAALTTGGTEHAGLSELLWASPEQIAKLREAARARPTMLSASPSVGATMIVNAPAAGDRRETDSDQSGTTRQNRRRRADDNFAPARDGAFEAGLADYQQNRSFITRTRVVIGVVAILVIGVGVAMFYPSSPSKIHQRAPETQPVETRTAPVPESTPPPVPSTVQAVPELHPKAPSAVRKTPKPPVVTATEQPTEAPRKAPAMTIQGFEGNATYDGMTQKDIPRLLQWARSDAGNGRYEKAGQEYRVILALDPGNADAKEGLRKLQLAQQGDH